MALISEVRRMLHFFAFPLALLVRNVAFNISACDPQGTILNAKAADDVRAAVRVPFTQILPTTLKVRHLHSAFDSATQRA